MALGQAGYNELWGGDARLLRVSGGSKSGELANRPNCKQTITNCQWQSYSVGDVQSDAGHEGYPLLGNVWLIVSVLGLYRTVSVSQPGPDPSDCRIFMERDESARESVDRINPTGNIQSA